MFKQITVSLFFFAFSCFMFGQTWTEVSQLPSPSPNINSISVVDQNTIWVACDGSAVYKSTDGGATWQLKAPSTGQNLYGISAIDDMNCWVGTGDGAIYHTSDGGDTWTQQIIVSGSFINGIKMFDANNGVYVGDPPGSGQPYQFRYTIDGGTNWTLSPSAPTAGNEFGVINAWDWTDPNHFWIGSANLTVNATSAKVFYTANGFDGTFMTVNVTGTGGSQGLYYQAVGFTDNMHGVIGSNGNNIMKTTDGGATWSATNIPPGVTTFAAINMYGFKDGSNIIRMSLNETSGYRMFMTTDYGNTWTEETLPADAALNGVQHMQFINENLGYAGCGAGYFIKYTGPVPVELTSFTANALSGKVNLNWKTATETNNRGFEIERQVVNNDQKSEWTTIGFKEGQGTTTEPQDYSYSDDISNLTANSISYRLKQVDFDGKATYSKVVNVDNIIPAEYALYQNYPNPFNPSTVIKYQLPADNFVSLKVYNSLGQEVSTLVNGTIQAGIHQVTFNANKLSSGVYYYILRIGDINNNSFVKTGKMMLMK